MGNASGNPRGFTPNATYNATKMSGCKDINGTGEIIPIGMPMFCLTSHWHHDYVENTNKKTGNIVELVNDSIKQ